MKKFDLVSIGDNAIDAFIKLSEAELHCDINRTTCKICMDFAAKIPYESLTEVPAGGNSSNVALGVSKLGLNTTYLSGIGDDQNGQKTVATLIAGGVDDSLLIKQSKQATNYNYVLWYQDDRTILVKHEPHVYVWPAELTPPNLIYLSSVSDENLSLHGQLAEWLSNHSETKLVFSPGTWQVKAGIDKLKNIYAQTEVFLANRQEAEQILGLQDQPSQNKLKDLALAIRQLGPKIVILTDGENGATGLDQDGHFWQTPIWKTNTLERTGAGDAFAAACLAGLFHQQNLPEALTWGAINSASVVEQVGAHAGQLTRAEIESRLSANPTFHATEI